MWLRGATGGGVEGVNQHRYPRHDNHAVAVCVQECVRG